VEVFPGFEPDSLARRNSHFSAGSGVSSDAGLARLYGEDAETAELDAVAFGQGLFHGLEDGIDGCFSLGADEPGPVDDALDEILFDQRCTFQKVLQGYPVCTSG
jgi:hypothetical protein